MNLLSELDNITKRLHEQEVDYALCGGLAMAIHSRPRATIDIDLLVHHSQLVKVKEIAHQLGFDIEAKPMLFAGGKVPIHRVSKVIPGTVELLSLDLLVATEATQDALQGRERVEWKNGILWVVSKEGLISLKRLRGSGQDQDDIKQLQS